jgi:hypothetical protein
MIWNSAARNAEDSKVFHLFRELGTGGGMGPTDSRKAEKYRRKRRPGHELPSNRLLAHSGTAT